MSDEKRQSLSNINLLTATTTSSTLIKLAEKNVLISSAGYLQNEVDCEALTKSYQHFFTTDDIYWHNAQFTESAFSSPQAFQIMLSLLKDEGRH